jgi:hypothetical protein
MATARFSDRQKSVTVSDYFDLQKILFRTTFAETGLECTCAFVDAVDKALMKKGTCEVRGYVGPNASLDMDITAAANYG